MANKLTTVVSVLLKLFSILNSDEFSVQDLLNFAALHYAQAMAAMNDAHERAADATALGRARSKGGRTTRSARRTGCDGQRR